MSAAERIAVASAVPEVAAQELEAILQRMGSIGRPEPANVRAAVVAPPPAAADEPSPHEHRWPGVVAGGTTPPSWDEDALRAVLESVPDAVIAANIHGTMLLVNRQTEDLFGYPRGELLGRPVEILMPERFRAGHVKQRDSYFADPRIRPMGANLDLWGRRRDGREFPVEISLSPLRTPTGLLVTTTVRDISLRRQAEDQ